MKMPGASKRELTKQEELNHLINWFGEFSEMQKSDFFKIILKKYASSNVNVDLVESAIKDMTVNDRPPTIFQCRMKLLDDWFANWSDEEKEDLLIRLKNLDSAFMDIFQSTLDGVTPLEEEIFRQPLIPQLRSISEMKAVQNCSPMKPLNGSATSNGTNGTNGTNGCNHDASSPSPSEENESPSEAKIVAEPDVVNGQNGATNGEEKAAVVEVEG